MNILTFILIYYVCIVRSKHQNSYSTDQTENLLKTKSIPYNEEEEQPESDCSVSEEEQIMQIRKMNDIIKEGNQGLKQTTEENTILVLGNAGTGKTTFVQFMAGDNSKIFSKETGNDTGDFLIYGDKIGSSPTESFTLYPEQVTKSANASFTDTPGFSDTRSEVHEVIASYAMKKYLTGIKSVKIVLLVTYYSLEQGVYKEDFIDLLQHLTNFVKNVDDHDKSIALIATKVPNKYKVKGSSTILIPDEKIIADIGEYLFKVKNALAEKLTNTKEENKVLFLKKAIKILRGLQDVDERGRFTRINIFHRPTTSGALSELDTLQNSKQSLQNTLYENVAYTQISNDDIGYALSYRAEIYLNSIVKCMNDYIIKTSSNIFKVIHNHYSKKMKTYNDIYILRKKEQNLKQELQTLQNDLKKTNSFTEYFEILDSYLTEKEIQGIDKNKLTKVLQIQEYTNNIKPFINLHPTFSTVVWAEQMKFALDDFQERLSWNNFLIELFEHFSTYMKQKSDGANKTNDTLKTVLTNFDASLYDNFNNFNTLMSDNNKIIDLKEIVSITLNGQTKSECDSSGKLTIVGNYIKISAFSNEATIRNLCETTLRTVIIYAVHTVFVDDDLKGNYFQGIDLMIAAPKWEIVGSRHIDISGTNGETNENAAKQSSLFGERGQDGKPGSPGKNGGNFLGIGLQFTHSENLVISANGGNGGIGQRGGNGHAGNPGEDGYKQFYIDMPSTENVFDSFNKGYINFPFLTPDDIAEKKNELEMVEQSNTCAGNITIYTHHGKSGTIGSSGGDGGKGGSGGNPGTVLIIGDNTTLPHFIINNSTGNKGTDGLGGIGGLIGKAGTPITCIKTVIKYAPNNDYDIAQSYYIDTDFWTCKNWYLTEPNYKCEENERGSDGRTGYVIDGILKPTPTAIYDFSPDLYNYVTLLKDYENNKYLTSYMRKLQNLIYNNVFFKTSNFWKFFLIPQT